MARCDVPGCDWYGKRAGLKIHQAKVHGIHRGYGEGFGEASCRIDESRETFALETTVNYDTGKVTIREVEPKAEEVDYPDLPEMHEPEVVRW